MKLGNVRLLVKDFDACYEFWQDTLGSTATFGKPGDSYAHFELSGGGDVAIFDRELMAEAIGRSSMPSDVTAMDRVCLVIEVANVDETHAQLVEKGVEFEVGPTDMQQWGIRTAHLRDPDGTLIELASSL